MIGAVLERGHTCPRRQFRSFLRRCLRPASPLAAANAGASSLWDDDDDDNDCADDDDDEGLEDRWWTTTEKEEGRLPSRPWEGLRLRVERGVR